MFNSINSTVLGLVFGLIVVYFITLYISLHGWGYAGYRSNYYRVPHFYSSRGVNHYPDDNTRSAANGGTTREGGGPHEGK